MHSLRREWIDQPDRLAALLRDLRGAATVGIDTEFVRTRTFFAQLGLIQLFADGCCWLIDPLPIGDWAAFGEFLGDPGTIKVIHSGSEDFEILYRLSERPLAGFFDTQVGAALTGLGPSLSYQALVSELIGVELPKGETRSNWLRRPLSRAQLTYAAHDVEHLIDLHTALSARLDELGRSQWAAEDCARAARPPASEARAIRQQFRRLKFCWKLNARQRAVAYALLTWREQRARRIDRPRNWLLDDNVIYAISTALPDSLQELGRSTELSARTLERNGRRLLAIVRTARTDGEAPPAPPPPLDRSLRPLLNRLRSRVKSRASELGLAPEVLCGRRQLVYLLNHRRLPESLRGWRRGVIGDELLDLLERELESEPEQQSS